MKREGSKKSYLIGRRPANEPPVVRQQSPKRLGDEKRSDYFSAYGRGLNFDSKKLYNLEESPSYDSN